MTQKECVQVVRAAGFSGYDKSLDSKANNPGKYGVQRTAEAQAALDAVATARNGGLPAKQCKRSGDRHKLPQRISARVSKGQLERVKNAIEVCGYRTVQSWLGTCIYRLLDEADKKKAPAGAVNTNRGADKKSTSKKYHETGGVSNV